MLDCGVGEGLEGLWEGGEGFGGDELVVVNELVC